MNIIKLSEVDSTNNYIKEHCKDLPDGSVVTAELQTAGRGRRGHSWSADRGMLPLSVLLRNPCELETLTPRVGLAVCEAVESVAKNQGVELKIGIKWPNDLILANHKVCGILCESVFFGDNVDAICGIGVNISQDKAFFEQLNLPHGGSLKMLAGFEPPRDKLVEKIAENVIKREAMSFAECIGEYRSRVINLGKEVRITGSEERTALAVDIADNGFLVCRDENGEFAVSAGEVTVRGIDGYL